MFNTKETPPGPNILPQRQVQSLALVTAFLFLACLAYYFADPTTPMRFWTCPFHKLTGLDCPGCGGQRAAHMLLHGRLYDALSLNAFAVLFVFPLIIYAYLSFTLNTLGIARLPMIKADMRWIMALTLAGIVFGILRNLPIAPFNSFGP